MTHSRTHSASPSPTTTLRCWSSRWRTKMLKTTTWLRRSTFRRKWTRWWRIQSPEIGCVGGGCPPSSMPCRTGTARIRRVNQGCTTMGQMDTLGKYKAWYDTHNPIPHLLCIYLFITLHSILQKASTGIEPHYLYVWVPLHRYDDTSTQKLVSTNLYN
jgi:hypothetical protein